jgi:DNA-binding MarR family transcriptional regulator
MTPALREEIQQRKPFASLEQEAFLSIGRTEAGLRDAFEQVLKPFGISLTQYNVLRILRGAGPEGLCRNDIRDRLITRMPDVTRLLDRMEQAGLITRARSTADRRQVTTRMTARGRQMVNALDGPVAAEHARRLGHLSKSRLRALIELLARVRQGVA